MGLETATVIALAGAAVSAGGSIIQGQQQAKQFAFQAAVQRQQARREQEIAAIEEQRNRKESAAILASRRARLAASGIQPGEGTALLGTEELAGEAELDALLIRAGGEGRSTALLNEATLSGAKGSAASTAGFVKAGSTLLTAGGKAFESKKKP